MTELIYEKNEYDFGRFLIDGEEVDDAGKDRLASLLERTNYTCFVYDVKSDPNDFEIEADGVLIPLSISDALSNLRKKSLHFRAVFTIFD